MALIKCSFKVRAFIIKCCSSPPSKECHNTRADVSKFIDAARGAVGSESSVRHHPFIVKGLKGSVRFFSGSLVAPTLEFLLVAPDAFDSTFTSGGILGGRGSALVVLSASPPDDR